MEPSRESFLDVAETMIFEMTRDTAFLKSRTELIKIFVGIMGRVGDVMLRERKKYKEEGEVPYDKTREVDVLITDLICEQISKYPEHCDIFCSEDREPKSISGNTGPKVVLVDAIDNTKGYVNMKRKDFGSSLLCFNNRGEITMSIFILPALRIMFCAMYGEGAWMNGERLVSLHWQHLPLIPRAHIRRPREGSAVPDDVKNFYDTKEEEYKKEFFDVARGPDFTALNSLSIAQGQGPTKFLYYAKPWDILAPASIALAAGARVTLPLLKVPFFPLPEVLIQKITGSIAERKKLEETGNFRDLYLIEWPQDW